jgi:hypothetical protein
MRVVALTLFAALVAACTAGSGPATQLPTGREPPGPGQEPGATGPDRTTGPDSPGGGGGAACPKCDYVYSCVVTLGLESTDVELTAEQKDNGCELHSRVDEGQSSRDEVVGELACAEGAFLPAGQGDTAGTGPKIGLTTEANGGFVVTFGNLGTIACTPEKPYVPPVNGPPQAGNGG